MNPGELDSIKIERGRTKNPFQDLLIKEVD
jgi:hypothetical protein